MAIIIPNGEYLVYYDTLRLNLMAKINIRNEKGDGKLERYDLNGKMVYSTTLSIDKINGLFILYKSNGAEIVQILAENHSPKIFILSTKYTYNMSMDQLRVEGNLLVKNKDNPVFDVDIHNGSKVALNYYNLFGQLISTTRFNSKNDLHGVNNHSLFRGADYTFTAENGVRIQPAIIKNSLFGRDLKLNFTNNNVSSVG